MRNEACGGAAPDNGRIGARPSGMPVPGRRPAPLASPELVCGVCAFLSALLSWLLNVGVFPTTSIVFPLGREVQTFSAILLTVAIAACALFRPALLRVGPLSACACGLVLAGCALLALFPGSAGLATAGLVLRALAARWCSVLIALACARAGADGRLAVGLTLGVLAAVLVETLVPAPSYGASLALMACTTLLLVALPAGLAADFAERAVAAGPAREAMVASPSSFVPPTNQVFVLVLIFSAASGFSLALRSVDYTPLSSPVQLAALAAVAAWFLACGRRPAWERRRLDALFVLSALLIVAGFLCAPVDLLAGRGVSNGLLLAGRNCFNVLVWLSMAALCARNPGGAFLVIAYACIASGLGMFAGADSGHLVNAVLADMPDAVSVAAGTAVLALFAYAMTGLRGFSFGETVRGVLPSAPVTAPDVAAPSRQELFERACERAAADAGLTKREAEVLVALARGRNASHIQEELGISYNTAKTHVKRIYTKLGVHTQQELIDLVERGMGEGDGDGDGDGGFPAAG